MVCSIMSSLKILMMNNNDIINHINIILHIKKKNLDICYFIFYCQKPIPTKTIQQYSINEYEKYIYDSDIVIDMNPSLDNYKNLLYCISNNIPIIVNKKFTSIDCKEMLFEGIDDIINILNKNDLYNYTQHIKELNSKMKDIIELEYKMDIKKNINYEIIKTRNSNHILNLYTFLVDLNDNYRLKDYIECITRNIQLQFLNKIYLFVRKDYNIEYIPNKILDNSKVILINVDNYNIETIFNVVNKNESDINCILNLDIYINNSDVFCEYINNLIKNNKNVYCLSRIESDKEKYWELAKLKNLYYSLTQDVWLFKGKIDISRLNKNIILGNVWNDIIFNNYLYENNYNLINIIQEKTVVRLDTYTLHKKEYIDPIRTMNENINLSDEKYHLLPERNSIQNCSIDNLIAKLNINDDQIYDIKKYIMNKYIKINH